MIDRGNKNIVLKLGSRIFLRILNKILDSRNVLDLKVVSLWGRTPSCEDKFSDQVQW